MKVGVELKGTGVVESLDEKLLLLCKALVHADESQGSEIRALKLLALTIAHKDGAPNAEAAPRIASEVLLDAAVIASMECSVPPAEIRKYVDEALAMSESAHAVIKLAGGVINPDGSITMPDGTVLQ